MSEKLKLLVVEDEEIIRNGLIDVFVFHGYEVDSAGDGEEGLRKAQTGKYDLILLDVMLPVKDGFSICNEIRSRDRDQPIIMLTAKTTDEDIITGLTLGADDYVAKPFSVQELVLRVEAVLRRTRKLQLRDRELQIGSDLCILLYLQQNSDRPVPRGELLSEVWSYAKGSCIETRTVDIHIAKLRRKIEADPKNPCFLITVRGEGYKLMANSAKDPE
jgi:DNA-binding response OmpR family regulator